jgi:hypothetical protein
MQIIWMVMVTLVLALSGVLALALVTRRAAWTRRRTMPPGRLGAEPVRVVPGGDQQGARGLHPVTLRRAVGPAGNCH